jgi:hypothetical protein
VTFDLPEIRGIPGDIVSVPLRVRTNTPLSLVAWSVEFDPQVLQLVDPPRLSAVLERLLETLDDPAAFLFEWYADNEAGWAQFLLVPDFQGRAQFAIPPRLLVSAAIMDFRLENGAPAGEHPLRFTRPEAAEYASQFFDGDLAVYNAARPSGRPFGREDSFEDAAAPELDDGVVLAIIGDVGFFLRGDANLDDALDISDAMTILGALFLGDEPLPCEEVADANDDGNVDLSDPVAILGYLFQGTQQNSLAVWTREATADESVECPLPDEGAP